MPNDPRLAWDHVKVPDGGIPVEDLPADIGGETTALVPWTTTTADGPALMWDDDDNLMMIEEPR